MGDLKALVLLHVDTRHWDEVRVWCVCVCVCVCVERKLINHTQLSVFETVKVPVVVCEGRFRCKVE